MVNNRTLKTLNSPEGLNERRGYNWGDGLKINIRNRENPTESRPILSSQGTISHLLCTKKKSNQSIFSLRDTSPVQSRA